jgi:hypothetical protein
VVIRPWSESHRLVLEREQQEGARPVRVLDVAVVEARVPEQRRRLVTQDARDRDARKIADRSAVDLARRADVGQQRAWDRHGVEKVVVPLERVQVHQERAARVGRVGRVHAAVRAAREVPQQPGVHGAEEQLARLGPLARAVDVVEDPPHLRPREVGGQRQAAAVAEAVLALA